MGRWVRLLGKEEWKGGVESESAGSEEERGGREWVGQRWVKGREYGAARGIAELG